MKFYTTKFSSHASLLPCDVTETKRSLPPYFDVFQSQFPLASSKRETRLKNEKDKKSEASLMGAYMDVRDRNETQLAAVFRRFSVEFFPAEQMNMQMLNHLSTVFALVDNHTIPFF